MNDKKISMEKNTVRTWSGHADPHEARQPGGLLIAALVACASERGETLCEMSAKVGVVYGYLSQLRKGLRRVDSISDDFAQNCAAYLGISRIEVLVMAGRVTPADFYASRDEFAQEVARAMTFICADPQWTSLMTPTLREADSASRFALVRLYETATGSVLLKGRLDQNSIFEKVSLRGSRATAEGVMGARRRRTSKVGAGNLRPQRASGA
jgi:hypothetical protein